MVNFDEVKNLCHGRIRELLPSWLPGGTVSGNEYECSDITGGHGKSLKVNLTTGKWADFSTNLRGGDLISLWAAIKHAGNNVEAAKDLNKMFGGRAVVPRKTNVPPQLKYNIVKPPPDIATPSMTHNKFGEPSEFYTYRDKSGEPLFFIARYDLDDGKKQFCPFSYTDHKAWIKKAWGVPRPLYGLEELTDTQSKILIVEGEKTCEAARRLCGRHYQVISWSGGAQAVDKTDWSPLHGSKEILIWPDADFPGREAAAKLSGLILTKSPVTTVKVINAAHEQEGWDLADALAEGMTFNEVMAWARPKVTIVPPPKIPDSISINVSAPDPNDMEHSPDMTQLWRDLGLALSKTNGQPIINLENLMRAFSRLPALNNILKYDEFSDTDFIMFDASKIDKSKHYEKLSEPHILAMTAFIQRYVGLHRVSDDLIGKAIRLVSYGNKFNEPAEWIKSLKWDGEARVREWLKTYLGCKSDEAYVRAAGTNFWVSLCARVFQPGCKVDNMLILEGPQGSRKSSMLEAIGGKWFSQMTEKVGSKDFMQAFRGKLLIEIAELDSFSKAEESAIKAMITSTKDTYRPSFGRLTNDYPRRCVFVGTTNDDKYLRDVTGARRFWPIKTESIDLKAIVRDREQLFAEAYQLYRNGETWYEMPQKETLEIQESKRVHDAWEGLIYQWLSDGNKVATTTPEVGKMCLGIEYGRLNQQEQKRISRVLRALGWHSKSVRNKDSNTFVWTWVKTPDTVVQETKKVNLEDLPNQAEKIHLNGYQLEPENQENFTQESYDSESTFF